MIGGNLSSTFIVEKQLFPVKVSSTNTKIGEPISLQFKIGCETTSAHSGGVVPVKITSGVNITVPLGGKLTLISAIQVMIEGIACRLTVLKQDAVLPPGSVAVIVTKFEPTSEQVKTAGFEVYVSGQLSLALDSNMSDVNSNVPSIGSTALISAKHAIEGGNLSSITTLEKQLLPLVRSLTTTNIFDPTSAHEKLFGLTLKGPHDGEDELSTSVGVIIAMPAASNDTFKLL